VRRIDHAAVIGYALLQAAELGLDGWYWPDSRRVSRKGWPDLTFANKHGGLMFREVKTGSAVLTPAQVRVGYIMKAGGHDWAVWREGDIPAGIIRDQLAALAWYRGRPLNLRGGIL
jgi:hypothetical protein